MGLLGIFKRPWIGNGNSLPMTAFGGSGFLANIRWKTNATDVNGTLVLDEIAGGAVYYSSFTAGRTITTPTAAQIITAMGDDYSIGDSFSFIVSAGAAFALTWAAGTGVTLVGRPTVPASSWTIVTITRSGAATVNFHVA